MVTVPAWDRLTAGNASSPSWEPFRPGTTAGRSRWSLAETTMLVQQWTAFWKPCLRGLAYDANHVEPRTNTKCMGTKTQRLVKSPQISVHHGARGCARTGHGARGRAASRQHVWGACGGERLQRNMRVGDDEANDTLTKTPYCPYLHALPYPLVITLAPYPPLESVREQSASMVRRDDGKLFEQMHKICNCHLLLTLAQC